MYEHINEMHIIIFFNKSNMSNVMIKDNYGFTPLHYAVRHCSANAVWLLVSYGASLYDYDNLDLDYSPDMVCLVMYVFNILWYGMPCDVIF